ncbi:hypothetical protein Csa_001789 [Cucumis sativus]|uniref:Uncharacterized protein n=1 Tax=Cucumis sativus TaxID=3659 RepID=A0A0A0LET3_CUCSA|nr:hypothetical protein Csa_001789 [Cucumis sativus]
MRGLNREKLHCTATICKCPKTTFDLQRRSEKLPVGDQAIEENRVKDETGRKLPGFLGSKEGSED